MPFVSGNRSHHIDGVKFPLTVFFAMTCKCEIHKTCGRTAFQMWPFNVAGCRITLSHGLVILASSSKMVENVVYDENIILKFMLHF